MGVSEGLYLAAGLLCIVFLIYRPLKKFRSTRERQTITFLLINILITSIVSVLETHLTSINAPNLLLVNQIESFTYFILHNMLAPLFALYIMLITGAAKNKTKKFFIIFYAPAILVELLVLLTPFLHIVYYHDVVDGVVTYHRGWGVWLLYVIGAVYLAYAFYAIIRSKKVLDKSFVSAYQVFFYMVVIGVIIQAIFANLQIETFIDALALCGIVMTVDSNDGLYDAVTKISNREAYKLNIGLYHQYGYRYSVINIRILNLAYYDHIILSEDHNKMMRRIAHKLSTIAPHAEIYKYDRATFIVLVPGREEPREILNKIVEFFSLTLFVAGVNVDFQTVISLAHAPKDVKFPEAHYRLAEYVPDTHQQMTVLKGNDLNFLRRNIWVQEAIQRAIKNKSFLIYYQPIWDKDARCIISCEALCRLRDAELGMIPPEEFIKVAEDSGNIIELGEAVFERVCEDFATKRLDKMGIKYVEVNMSLYQLTSKDLIDHLLNIIRKYRLRPSMINLEITETTSVLEIKNFKKVIDDLLVAGFTLSLDDYGTAYSNITNAISTNYLNIKIDSSILWKSNVDENIKKLLETTIKTFRSFGNNIIQEGVETKEQYDLVTKAGANLIQGYYISKPLNIDDLVTFIKGFKGVQ